MNELAENTQESPEDFIDLPNSNTIEVPEPEKELKIDIIDDRPEEDQKPKRASSDDVDEEIEGIGNKTKKRIVTAIILPLEKMIHCVVAKNLLETMFQSLRPVQ